MKLLLDENLPKRLKQDFPNHEIYTIVDKGWAGISNGKLLSLLIEEKFDALLTFDKNLQFQQNFEKYSIAVVVFNAPDNRYETLKTLAPKANHLILSGLKPGPSEISMG